MSFDYGFRTKNASGSYVIDGRHRNSMLMTESDLGKGFHYIQVGRIGMPSIAVKGGCGRIVSTNFNGNICESVRLYIIPHATNAQVRVYSAPSPDKKDNYGLSVYNTTGELVYSSSEDLLDVREAFRESSDIGWHDSTEEPPGYRVFSTIITPQGNRISSYVRDNPVSGSWLLLNSTIAFGGNHVMIGDYGHQWDSTYVLCAGIDRGLVYLMTDNELLVQDTYRHPPILHRQIKKMLCIGAYIVTLND